MSAKYRSEIRDNEIRDLLQKVKAQKYGNYLRKIRPIEGRDKRRFFAVLHVPPVTSPVEAVRAAIVAEVRAR